MLRGEKVGLRARDEADGPILHAELYDDVPTQARADSRPWRPLSPKAPQAPYAPPTGDSAETSANFSVVELGADGSPGELAGEASLWMIDTHNRSAHIGIGLRPAFRGRGLGTDVVRVLCLYGFVIRGLHRLQIDTLGDNDAMIKVAINAGFTQEATLRRAAWVYGEFLDEVLLGQLAEEYTAPKA